MESVEDWPVAGILVHAAGRSAAGFRVVDIWDSEKAFQQFGDKLMPILKEVGIEGGPDVYQTHAFVTA